MNRSKLFEWLLDNDCPWEFDVRTLDLWETDKVTLVFSEKPSDNKEPGDFEIENGVLHL